jgi:hypothetical protein
MAEQNQTAQERVRAPSTIDLVEDQAQVMVDTWGHTGEIIKGMIVNRADAESAGYDWDHALRVGAIRLLTEAEARPESHPTTFATLADGSPDHGLRRSTRFHSGFVDGADHVTITTPSGPAEPAEFAKPTIDSGLQGDPPYPIQVVGSPEEVQAATPRAPEVVPTQSGSAYATAEEAEAQRAAEAGEPANEQRVARRGRNRE